MKWIKYSHYTGDDFGIDAEDLLNALSDFLLQSGFNAQSMRFSEFNEHSLEDLKHAIQQALENGQLFSDEQLEKMMEQLQAMSEEQMEKLLDNLVQKLVDDGHITVEEPGDQPQRRRTRRQRSGRQGEVRSHRQIARLPGIQDAEGPARLARQVELRPPRYARPGDRRRILRLVASSTNSATP